MQNKSNVVVIMVDEMRYDLLGCLNQKIKTPNLDTLAQDGTLFQEAYCASPLCVPSRVSMFTAQQVRKNGAAYNGEQYQISEHNQQGFLETLKQQNYICGMIGKNDTFTTQYMRSMFDVVEEYTHWGRCDVKASETEKNIFAYRNHEYRPGFCFPHNRWEMLGEGLINRPEPFDKKECTTYKIAEYGSKFIIDHRDTPFFLLCSFPDPHWPITVCEPYFSMYNQNDMELEYEDTSFENKPFEHFIQAHVNGYDKYSAEEKKRILSIYYGMISYIDDSIGMLIQTLKQNDLYDNTLIVFTSDHGDFGGRYGLVGKTKAFYEPLIRIPLIMKLPGCQSVVSTNAMVSNIDILPTIFDYLNLPIASSVDGSSFLDAFFDSSYIHRQTVFAEVGIPVDPMPAYSASDFPKLKAEGEAQYGAFWFIDFTGKGKAVMIKNQRYKYCRYFDRAEELYDLYHDPGEQHNLANTEDYFSIKDQMKNMLIDYLSTN